MFLALATPATWADQSQAAMPEVARVCTTCHGAHFEGNIALNAPNIAGLSASYLQRQLLHFADGVRGVDARDSVGVVMRNAVAKLDKNTIPAISTYIAALPRAKQAAKLPVFNQTNGRNYYNGICSACHGARGQGTEALFAPRLSGMDLNYLTRQYANFKNDLRGADSTDKYGKQMKTMSKALPDDRTVADVLAYAASLE